VAAYANGLTGTFTYDDKAIVRDNPRIREPARIEEVVATPYFGGPRGSGTAYRPVLLLSFAMEWWIHGRDPFALHAVNLFLHALAVLLLERLFRRSGVPPAPSFLASLFFAVAPIHVEAVTSLVGRGETLAAVFVLSFLHAAWSACFAVSGERRGRLPRRMVFGGAALVFYALGILTKESAVVAPGLLFLLLAFSSGGGLVSRAGSAFRRGAAVYAGGAAVLAGTFVLRGWVLGGFLRAPGWGIFEVENPLAPLPAPARIANATLLLLRYAGRTIFPLHLSVDESAWSIPNVTLRSPLALAGVLVVVALLLAALRALAHGSAIALGVLFFFVAFVPTANVFFPIGTIFGERIAYLPSAGLCLALGVVCARGAASFAELRRPAVAVSGAIALLFSIRTVIRNPAWWTDWSIFANSVATSPRSAKAHYNWAYVCAEGGRLEEARDHYARAVALYSGYWDAWAGKGRMERELGRTAEARESYTRSLQANAGYENGFFGLGLVYEKEERLADAEATYRRGLAKNRDSLPLAYRLACVLADEDAPEAEAEAAWRRAIQLGPDSAAAHAGYAEWLLDQDRSEEAAREARRAVRIEPAAADALRVLARRRGDEDVSFGSALAWEKTCRASKSREDFEELARVAKANAEYRPRFERVRDALAKAIRD